MELLTAEEVAAKLKLSESTIWNWYYGRKSAPAEFPPPIKVSSLVRWRVSDINLYISCAPFTTFGCIKPPTASLELSNNILVSSNSNILSEPKRGRGRPRKIFVTCDGGEK